MIFNLNKIQKILKKNTEFAFLFLLMTVAVLSTTFYNNKKMIANENLKNTINNIYFQKSIHHILDSLNPRYKNIKHKISNGETFDRILKNYSMVKIILPFPMIPNL